MSAAASSLPQPPSGATLIFALGVCGMFCGFVGVGAWVLGRDYDRRCRAREVRPAPLAVAGEVLGIVGVLVHGTLLVLATALAAAA